MSRESIDQDLLDRYLAGECGPAEVAGIETYLAAHPGVAAAITRARSELDPGASLPRNTLASLHALHARIAQADHPTSRLSPAQVTLSAARSSVAGRHRAVAVVVAAALTLAAGAAFVRLGRASADGSAMQQYATAVGQRLTVALSDGTQFTLAPASTLRVPLDYGRARREVELDGEAYFVVRHDAAHPFTVRAEGAIAQDVGTRFAVRAYADGQPPRVAVADGAVTVAGAVGAQAGRAVMLHAGEVAMVSDGQAAIVARGVDTTAYLGWTGGELVFDGTPLRDALTELGRWYGLDFHLGDSSLARVRLRMTVQGASRDELLDGLVLLLNARYERQGTHVTIYRRQRTR